METRQDSLVAAKKKPRRVFVSGVEADLHTCSRTVTVQTCSHRFDFKAGSDFDQLAANSYKEQSQVDDRQRIPALQTANVPVDIFWSF